MRHEPKLKEDAKHLSIIAGSAMMAAALTAALVVVPLRARAGSTPAPRGPSSVDAGPAGETGARLILIGHHAHRDANGERDLHVVVIRTGDGKRVVTVRTDGSTSVARVQDLSESRSTH